MTDEPRSGAEDDASAEPIETTEIASGNGSSTVPWWSRQVETDGSDIVPGQRRTPPDEILPGDGFAATAGRDALPPSPPFDPPASPWPLSSDPPADDAVTPPLSAAAPPVPPAAPVPPDDPTLPLSPPSDPTPTTPDVFAWVDPALNARPVSEPWFARIEQLRFEIRRVIVGQHRVVERVLVGLVAGGHCLLEGAPGLGKTRLLATLSRAIGGSFARIQFTPDLIPADIIGTRIYRASTEQFDVELGPIFANMVLADEINRAPAKVQSALLEVMAEHQVTIGGISHPVPSPFLVLATQNPIESEGVYALPEAQRDRFLMRIPVDYPSAIEEAEIVRRSSGDAVAAERILTLDDIRELQALARSVHVDALVADYAVRLVLATRAPHDHGLAKLAGVIHYGASPRASIGLLDAGRAMAVLRGRRWVSPQDIYDVAYDVLNHRLVLSFDALADGITVDEVLVELLSTVRAPVGVTDPVEVA